MCSASMILSLAHEVLAQWPRWARSKLHRFRSWQSVSVTQFSSPDISQECVRSTWQHICRTLVYLDDSYVSIVVIL
jgi:hypothetical protein